MVVNEVANRLDPRPARGRLLEQFPCDIGKPVGFAVAAAEQVDQRIRRQILDGVLHGRGNDHIGQAAVAHRAVRRETHTAGGGDNPAAPIAEAVAIGRDRHRRAGGEVIGHDDVGGARKMRAQHHDQGRRLRKVVNHLEADTNLHAKHPIPMVGAIQKRRCGGRRAACRTLFQRNSKCCLKYDPRMPAGSFSPSGLLISGKFSVHQEHGDESSRIQGNALVFALDWRESDSQSRRKSAKLMDA